MSDNLNNDNASKPEEEKLDISNIPIVDYYNNQDEIEAKQKEQEKKEEEMKQEEESPKDEEKKEDCPENCEDNGEEDGHQEEDPDTSGAQGDQGGNGEDDEKKGWKIVTDVKEFFGDVKDGITNSVMFVYRSRFIMLMVMLITFCSFIFGAYELNTKIVSGICLSFIIRLLFMEIKPSPIQSSMDKMIKQTLTGD